MSNITAPVETGTKYEAQNVIKMPMAAVKIFRGALIVLASGYINKPTNTTGELTVGEAEETVDNSAGNPGDKFIRVIRKGLRKVTGTVAQTDVGSAFYLSDDSGAGTLTATGKYNKLGKVETLDADGNKWVRFDESMPVI